MGHKLADYHAKKIDIVKKYFQRLNLQNLSKGALKLFYVVHLHPQPQ